MIKNYRTTQVLAVFFAITTVVLFFMNRQGTLLYYVSDGGAWLITIGNFVLLCISLTLFIAARATRNRPRGRELDALQSFADRKLYEAMARPEAIRFRVSYSINWRNRSTPLTSRSLSVLASTRSVLARPSS